MDKQTRNEKLSFDETSCKCGIRAAMDGCDVLSGGLKWVGSVFEHDWKYAIMVWDSVHCPSVEKELSYVPPFWVECFGRRNIVVVCIGVGITQ